MITLAQTLGRKNEKPSFLGLGFINSPLKQFFSLPQVRKTQQHFSQSITHKERDFSLAKVVFLLFFIVPNYL